MVNWNNKNNHSNINDLAITKNIIMKFLMVNISISITLYNLFLYNFY